MWRTLFKHITRIHILCFRSFLKILRRDREKCRCTLDTDPIGHGKGELTTIIRFKRINNQAEASFKKRQGLLVCLGPTYVNETTDKLTEVRSSIAQGTINSVVCEDVASACTIAFINKNISVHCTTHTSHVKSESMWMQYYNNQDRVINIHHSKFCWILRWEFPSFQEITVMSLCIRF